MHAILLLQRALTCLISTELPLSTCALHMNASPFHPFCNGRGSITNLSPKQILQGQGLSKDKLNVVLSKKMNQGTMKGLISEGQSPVPDMFDGIFSMWDLLAKVLMGNWLKFF
ncbi:hypothetical protein DUNSADRAFT_808 [Dunaliella salina]|uniref:Uncharacterized protein n=1 Tax=Dunaliella salina TaxID=3046 RepID=A0ABQ7GXR9_DUNSA|nr:hypothetical protein DUNSADRAFT_808 [Dunaliella salina]|eukprot:KAF5839406.1 hypothetical protein DUNSADRAFT_808 [Dunaliella salina]